MLSLSRVDRVYGRIDITGTLADGSPATLSAVDVAIIPAHTRPTSATTWTPVTLAGRIVSILIAGPDADPEDAFTVPGGDGELWVRVTDNPEAQAVKVDRVIVT